MLAKRLSSSLFLIVILGFGIFASVVLFRDYQELQVAKAEETRLVERLEKMQAASAKQETALAKLQTDPHYVESLIRTRLGYAKPGELIFRFE